MLATAAGLKTFAAETEPLAAQPVQGASDTSFELFLDYLMRAESNGRDTATNPRSTALGAFQFIENILMVARDASARGRWFPTSAAGARQSQLLPPGVRPTASDGPTWRTGVCTRRSGICAWRLAGRGGWHGTGEAQPRTPVDAAEAVSVSVPRCATGMT